LGKLLFNKDDSVVHDAACAIFNLSFVGGKIQPIIMEIGIALNDNSDEVKFYLLEAIFKYEKLELSPILDDIIGLTNNEVEVIQIYALSVLFGYINGRQGNLNTKLSETEFIKK